MLDVQVTQNHVRVAPSLLHNVLIRYLHPRNVSMVKSFCYVKLCENAHLHASPGSMTSIHNMWPSPPPPPPPSPVLGGTLGVFSSRAQKLPGMAGNSQSLQSLGISSCQGVRGHAAHAGMSYLSYLPLAHIYERILTIKVIHLAASIAFYR